MCIGLSIESPDQHVAHTMKVLPGMYKPTAIVTVSWRTDPTHGLLFATSPLPTSPSTLPSTFSLPAHVFPLVPASVLVNVPSTGTERT